MHSSIRLYSEEGEEKQSHSKENMLNESTCINLPSIEILSNKMDHYSHKDGDEKM